MTTTTDMATLLAELERLKQENQMLAERVDSAENVLDNLDYVYVEDYGYCNKEDLPENEERT